MDDQNKKSEPGVPSGQHVVIQEQINKNLGTLPPGEADRGDLLGEIVDTNNPPAQQREGSRDEP